MDNFDKHILSLLQQDSSLSLAEISEHVGLSQTPCWRRIQHLEKSGVIRKRVALLDSKQLNVGLTVFVNLKTNQHNPEWVDSVNHFASGSPEVTEFYRMSGDTDYLLKVLVPDMAAYDEFYKKLISQAGFSDVSSSFAMEQMKYSTEIPLTHC
ncbi:ArsR family transcriptional regulator [Psychrosphaera saromensis]|uniref:ArsR family transcriptional regulator n=1 Tax=Psychrosphaera saromensis TaxID=716813 RepID=A0A2S7UYJ4_9GAMM|nr:Lrp/AsnC family transcriptional regulator [Psychrosphaera saromensis]PQJ54808.1 ArsR family transcriptional regulator [Psychrosphaera saromensis]GHB56945.1 ArsR family transcriptional regulator [Psychrosphaera saromensis]GLQ13952.1 ArsR family transcriptional regulator [Psychrosphaera saromensis]